MNFTLKKENPIKSLGRAIDKKMIETQSGVLVERAKNGGRMARVKGMAMTALCMTALFSSLCFATGTDAGELGGVADRFTEGMGNIYALFRKVALPVAVVSLVACGIAYFWCGEKGMEAGKQWAKRIGIGLAVVGLAPLLISAIYGIFESNDTGIFK